MGIYIFITEEETRRLKSVSDKELNDVFQEALAFNDTILIEENTRLVHEGWISRKRVTKTTYTVYHESRSHDGSAYQARYQTCGSGDASIVFAYLFGIINGGLAVRKEATNV